MKLNNKGFTLVELLAVVVLLAIIITIAVPSVLGISNKIKKNLLDTKIDLILEDTKLYGQDNMSAIAASSKTFKGYPCQKMSIGDLLESGYISSDKDDEDAGYIVNPVDNTSLNDKMIILYKKNKRVVTVMADADLDGTEENSCS